jgi:DNA transposition AAA+ family ATPase
MKGLAAITELKRLHQEYSGRKFLVIEGQTGRGKTVFTRWYAVQDFQAVWLEADPDWTASWLMRDAAEALGLARQHATEANKRAITEAQRRESEAGRPRLMIIDEADRLIRSERLLETVRGLHDQGLPIILVAEAGAWGRIVRKSPRFADRVSQVVAFGDVTSQEVAATAQELADLRLPAELADYLCQQAGGNYRRAAKILEELERVCKANPGDLDKRRVDQAVKNLRIAESRKAAAR